MRGVVAPLFSTIKTHLFKLVQPLYKGLRPVYSYFNKLLKPKRAQFIATLTIVLLLIAIKGPSDSRPDIVGSVVRHYIEETSAFIIPDDTNLQLADISSLMGTSGTPPQQIQTAQKSPSPTTYTIQENSIQAVDSVSMDYLDSFKADQVVKYSVKSGDNIGSIAVDFGVSINTIIWANDLKDPDVLSLNQVLLIPPVTGIIHTVKNGDTIASIAGKYKADSSKILAFNDLKDDQSLQIGNELIVPGGEMPGPKPSVKSIAKGSGGSGIYVPVGNGQCVPFIQAHGYADLHGNAYQWSKYINTKAPAVGGVVVLRGGRYGHIALVTAVKSNSVQVVEQNYYGPYIIDHREISLSDKSIVGFIQ